MIKCASVAIVAACLLTFLSDPWCKASLPRCITWHLVAVDGQILQTDMYYVSHSPTQSQRPHKSPRWGRRAIVVLIGISAWNGRGQPNLLRDNNGVPLIIHVRSINVNNMKVSYSFPQSVRVSVGCPSSSYYFVGRHSRSRKMIPFRWFILWYNTTHHAPMISNPIHGNVIPADCWSRQERRPGTLWLRTVEDHAMTATTTFPLQIGQGDPRLDGRR